MCSSSLLVCDGQFLCSILFGVSISVRWRIVVELWPIGHVQNDKTFFPDHLSFQTREVWLNDAHLKKKDNKSHDSIYEIYNE